MYPDDKEVDPIKLEKIELDPETQAQVDEWLYNQRLQEKYGRFFAKQQALQDGTNNDQTIISYRAGRELDDELVRRIQLYLNENHKRDYMISRDFEHDMEFEKDLGEQKFDIEGMESAAEEGRKAWLSDYARQQELIFQMKADQLKIEAAIDET